MRDPPPASRWSSCWLDDVVSGVFDRGGNDCPVGLAVHSYGSGLEIHLDTGHARQWLDS